MAKLFEGGTLGSQANAPEIIVDVFTLNKYWRNKNEQEHYQNVKLMEDFMDDYQNTQFEE